MQTTIHGIALFRTIALRNKSQLQQELRSLGTECSEKEGLGTIKGLRSLLIESDTDWLNGTLRSLYSDPNHKKKLPYTAWLWQKSEEAELSELFAARLNQVEGVQFRTIAQQQNLPPSILLRHVIREYLAGSKCTQRSGS